VSDRGSRLTIVALFVAYASFFLCRANVDASLPLLSRAFGYDKAELGRLSSIAIAAYAVGKISLGPLGDVVGGARLIAIAVVGSVLASFGFGASTGLVALTAFAAANRWFQSAGWTGVVEVSSREFPKAEHGSVMGVISMSYEIGAVVALLLCGVLVESGLSWRALFVVNPIAFLILGWTMTRVIGASSRRARPAGVKDGDGAPSRENLLRRALWLAGSKPFWIALSLSFLLTFVRTGFLTWTPTFLAELGATHGGSVSGAILKSAVFPATGMAGALTAGILSDRFGPGRRAPVIAASLFVAVGAVLLLGYASAGNTSLALVAIAASGFFVLGAYSLVGGAIALDVGADRAAATAAGLIDAAGYVGGSLAGVLLGTMAERHGWAAAFDAIALAAFAAALVAVAWSLAPALATRSKEAA
jgi:sugar phosphate permease